jgi:hypothetical protein
MKERENKFPKVKVAKFYGSMGFFFIWALLTGLGSA